MTDPVFAHFKMNKVHDNPILLSHFSRVRLCATHRGSPPGSPVPGILQARTLEWVAISFSNAWKWKVKVKSLSRVRPLVTPWIAAYQAPLSMGFSRQEYWSGVPMPSPENPMNSMKRQNDRILKEELPRSVGAQYTTEDQWRNNSRKNEGKEPK